MAHRAAPRRGRINGWIEPHGLGYRARWREPGSSKKHTSPVFDSDEEAQRFLDVLRGDRARGIYYDPAKPRTPFNNIATDWFSRRVSTPETAGSRAKDRSHLNHILARWKDWEIGAIESGHVQDWINDLISGDDEEDDAEFAPLSANYITSIYGTFRLIMRQAEREHCLPMGNPIGGRGAVSLPPAGKDPRRFLTHAELDHLTEVTWQAEPAAWPLVYVAAYTGCRIGELMALERHHYNSIGKKLTIEQSVKKGGLVGSTKTGHSRTLDFDDDQLKAAMDAQLAGHDHHRIFPRPDGSQQQPYHFTKTAWQRIRREAGFPTLRFHDLRHTHISHLLAAGVDVHQVAYIAGHASTKMTLDRYGHFVPGRHEGALAKLRASRQEFA